jgi:hypothetical protein
MNEYSLEEEYTQKSSSRKIKLSFTDTAVSKVTHLLDPPPVLGAGTSRLPHKPVITTASRALGSLSKLPPRSGDVEETGSAPMPQGVSDASDSSVESPAAEFFEYDGVGELTPKSPDFKGKTKRDQQINFALLYIWSHNLFVGSPASRESITSAARKAGLLDQHFPSNLKRVHQLIISGESGLRLNGAGEKRVEEILSLLRAENVSGFAYWNSASRSVKRRAGANSKGHLKIDEALGHDLALGKLDARQLTTSDDQAIFAIWCLTKGNPLASAVSPKVAYAYLRQKYKNLPEVTENAFNKALTRSKLASRNSEKLFFLTPDGEAVVARWIAGESSPGVPTSE